MTSREFVDRYGPAQPGTAAETVDRWAREREADRLLNEPIAGAVVLGDLLVGDGALDQIPPDLRRAFEDLMGDKARTYDDVRALIVEKLGQGDRAMVGFVSKIQGQVGENVFLDAIREAGGSASLATSGNQEGWDIVVKQSDGTAQYIQVKVYRSPYGVTKHLEEVKAKIEARALVDGDTVIESIDFAVSSDIYETVRAEATAMGYPGEILSMDVTRDEVRGVVLDGVHNVGPEAVEHFLGELVGGVAIAGVLHAAANGFLVYKGAKSAEAFWADTTEGTMISGTAIGAGLGTEALLHKVAFIGGLPAYALVFATSVTTRGVLSRVMRRGDYASWLAAKAEESRALVALVASAPTPFEVA